MFQRAGCDVTYPSPGVKDHGAAGPEPSQKPLLSPRYNNPSRRACQASAPDLNCQTVPDPESQGR
jgi:hypothetical protein